MWAYRIVGSSAKDPQAIRSVVACLLILVGFTMAVASFAIEALKPILNPWPSLLVGLILAVVGIFVLVGWPRPPRG